MVTDQTLHSIRGWAQTDVPPCLRGEDNFLTRLVLGGKTVSMPTAASFAASSASSSSAAPADVAVLLLFVPPLC